MKRNKFWVVPCAAILLLGVGSILEAISHNVGQITAALLVTQSLGGIMYFPFLLVSGCCAGCFTGLCAQFLLQQKLHMMNAPQPRTEQ